ncbi:MAG: hypothetical protein AB1942_03420 [Pseudomonadota bacterium]
MSEAAPTIEGERFPDSGRRRVSVLSAAQGGAGLQFLVIYLAGAAFSAPLILRLNWYTNEFITGVGFVFCLGILALPMLGFRAGGRMIRRCAAVSAAAEIVDQRTQALFDDHAALQVNARETLAGCYLSTGKTDVAIVEALRADALRRAVVDRWEPSSWLVDAYRDELSEGLALVLMLQRLALQLGILFTFIGLAVAFSSDAFQMSGSVRQIPDMQPLVSALQVKFMASIAGLVSSISLVGLAWACRRQLAAAIARLEVMTDNVLTLAKTMRSDPSFASDFALLREGVQRMDHRIDGLADGYAKVVTTVRDGIADLVKARADLEAGLGQVLQAQGRVVKELDDFYGRVAPGTFTGEVAKAVEDSMAVFANRLDRTGAAVGELNGAIQALNETERSLARTPRFAGPSAALAPSTGISESRWTFGQDVSGWGEPTSFWDRVRKIASDISA